MANLRDLFKLGKLGLALRSIWSGSKEISVSKIKATFNVLYTFITGKQPPDETPTGDSKPAGDSEPITSNRRRRWKR